MNDLSHDEMKELLAAYVLGAVEDDERAVVRAHVLSCEECMREADDLSEATAFLDAGVDPVALPAGFAERVLDSAHGTDQETATADVVPLRKAPTRWGWLAAAAMLAALAVLSFSLLETRADLNRKERVVNALVRGGGMDLHGPTGAVGKMVPTSDGALFVAAGLQDAPADHQYQLWLIDGEEPSNGGVFDASDGTITLELDRSLEGVDAVAVTVEPTGGSPEPTSDPVISTT